ncbi:hypothetical protein ACVWYN_002226 [Pedobacter sp. UYP24]
MGGFAKTLGWKIFIIIIFLLFLTNSSFNSAEAADSNVVYATKNRNLTKRYNERKNVEGYYVSEPMDGETENCALSVKIKNVKGQYFYAFNITGEIVHGKVKITKADDPKELGIVFKGVKWAENNGYVSRNAQNEKFKLPNAIEGVWSESGIMIQNYGNSMNNYLLFASCGQKYINLVKK